MVNNSTNINKTNSHLSAYLTEHKKNSHLSAYLTEHKKNSHLSAYLTEHKKRPKQMMLDMQVLALDRHNNV
jgi:hypothetical protein